MPVKIHNHPLHPIWLGFRKMLAVIMAVWVFSLDREKGRIPELVINL